MVLTELSRGAVLGELGLLTGEVRSASVRAVRDSRLVHLTQDQFTGLATREVMAAMARGLAARLQQIAPPPSSQPRTSEVVIAVLGLDEAAPVRACSAALVKQLQQHLRVEDPGQVDRDGLERAEAAADKVVLTATAQDPVWFELCLRVADRVVLVSGSAAPPAHGLPGRPLGADLVLAGPPSDRG